MAPQALADLRLATLVGDAHLESMRAVCRTVDLQEQDWSSGPEKASPDLLLIESSGLRKGSGDGPISEEKVERALALVAWGESQGVPAVLWETALRARIDTPASLMRKVDHVLVADPEAAGSVTGKLEGGRPLRLPLAAQVIPGSPPPFDRRGQAVGFLARWPADFSGRRRQELEQILDAAIPHGLTVFQRERDAGRDELPDRFASSVAPVRSAGEAVESFQDSRVVIGFDPRNNGPRMVPQVAFDALASGAAVIGPNHLGLRSILPYSVIRVADREEAEAALDRVLGDEQEWSKHSSLSRKAILHAHTYSNRLATIASVVGLRLIPAAADKAAVTS